MSERDGEREREKEANPVQMAYGMNSSIVGRLAGCFRAVSEHMCSVLLWMETFFPASRWMPSAVAAAAAAAVARGFKLHVNSFNDPFHI